MTDEQKKRRGAVEMGPTAATVAANVRRLRDDVRGWSTYELSGKLAKAGRPIAPSAVAKIERGERQVTVDDLMALAATLRVSPSALLLPLVDDPAEDVEITGVGTVRADRAWDWMDGEMPIEEIKPGDPSGAILQFQVYARPAGRRMQLGASDGGDDG